ncbi:hypothetical protein [Streptomyces phage phiScoe44]|nr:hypothetical protein [Streptomyces phage phiScoe44]
MPLTASHFVFIKWKGVSPSHFSLVLNTLTVEIRGGTYLLQPLQM